jgi:hypothetical protein
MSKAPLDLGRPNFFEAKIEEIQSLLPSSELRL